MLTKEEIEKIEKIIAEKLSNLSTIPIVHKEIGTIDLDAFYDEINFDFVAEDSSFIFGTIGPFSYIFSRAVSIDSNGSLVRKRYFNIFPFTFFGDVSISKIAELISKILEYEVILENLKQVVLLDGSFEADMILSLKNMAQYEYIDYNLSEKVSLNVLGKMLASRINDLLKNGNENVKIFYFVKRPVDSSKLVKGDINDYLLLTRLFGAKSFCTKPILQEFSNETQKLVFGEYTTNYYMIYYRGRRCSPIYRIEIPNLYDPPEYLPYLSKIIKDYSGMDKYPVLLLLAHKLSNISLQEKKFIEKKIISMLPEDISGKEITYYS